MTYALQAAQRIKCKFRSSTLSFLFIIAYVNLFPILFGPENSIVGVIFTIMMSADVYKRQLHRSQTPINVSSFACLLTILHYNTYFSQHIHGSTAWWKYFTFSHSNYTVEEPTPPSKTPGTVSYTHLGQIIQGDDGCIILMEIVDDAGDTALFLRLCCFRGIA